jgi:hypothetical protein
MRRQLITIAVLGTAAALSLAGCGSSTSPKSQTGFKSLPATEQQVFEHSTVTEVEASIESLTSPNPYAGLGFDRVAGKRFTGGFQLMHLEGAPRFQGTSVCSSVRGNMVDEDSDGVVDTVITTLICHSTSGGSTFDITGNFAYGDPTPTTPDLNIDAGVNLTLTEANSTTGNASLTLSGSSSIVEPAAGTINLQDSWVLNDSLSNNPNGDNGTFKLTSNENATFAYSGPLQTSFGSLLAGTFSVTGDWTWLVQTSKVNVDLKFTVSTPTPLLIDPNTCTANIAGIQSGVLVIKFEDGATVTAKWDQCPSSPSITVV